MSERNVARDAAGSQPKLDRDQQGRFRARAVKCPLATNQRIDTVADYLAVIDAGFDADTIYWFRGHAGLKWRLIPSALRYRHVADRRSAIALLSEFRRVAHLKHKPAPDPNDDLGWMQVGQHYGLPTQLLDWTENALAALYFACDLPEEDGLVFFVNPALINRGASRSNDTVLDAHADAERIGKYIGGGTRNLRPVAVNPAWNSERIIAQKGTFTIHPLNNFEIGAKRGDYPSLVAVPIPKEAKAELMRQLRKVGVDELALYPELEHAAPELKRRAGISTAETL